MSCKNKCNEYICASISSNLSFKVSNYFRCFYILIIYKLRICSPIRIMKCRFGSMNSWIIKCNKLLTWNKAITIIRVAYSLWLQPVTSSFVFNLSSVKKYSFDFDFILCMDGLFFLKSTYKLKICSTCLAKTMPSLKHA